MVDRRRFIDFLRGNGYVSTPPAPTPTPRYENQGMLGRGGVTGGPALNRQYVAPRPGPPPPTLIRGGTFTPAQAQDMFLNSTFQNFNEPGEMNQQFLAINDPEIARQIAENKPLGAGQIFNAVASGVSQVPEVVDSIAGAIQHPQDTPVGDIGKDAGSSALDFYNWPLDKRKQATGDAIIASARGEGNPLAWQQLISINPKAFGLPGVPQGGSFSEADKNQIIQIASLAEANGEDPGRAVWEWYIGKFNLMQRAGTEIVGDPANWPFILTPVGETVLASEAAQGGSFGARLIRGGGYLLKAPEAVADAPIEIPKIGWRVARWGAGRKAREAEEGITAGVPILRNITASSGGQIARDAEAAIADQIDTAGRLNPEYAAQADENVANLQQDRVARAQEQAQQDLANEGVVPPAATTPNGQTAETVQPTTQPNGAAAPNGNGSVPPSPNVGPTQAEPGTIIITPGGDLVMGPNGPEIRPTSAQQDLSPSARPMSPRGQTTTGPTRPATEIFDDALGLNDPLPGRAEEAFTQWRDVLADPGRTEREIAVTDVPANSRIVATQPDLVSEHLDTYLADPNAASTADMPIAIKDGDTYYIIEGHHRTAAARESGLDTIQMRVINATPEADLAPVVPGESAVTLNDSPVDPFASPVRPDPSLPNTIPARDFRGNDFALNPDPSRIGRLSGARAERAVDRVAHDQPQVMEAIQSGTDLTGMKAWSDDVYLANNNLLRTESRADEAARTIPGAEPRVSALTDTGAVNPAYHDFAGTNKALSNALQGEWYGRFRFATHANGGDVRSISWTTDERLLRKVGDIDLAMRNGVPVQRTFKDMTKESAMDYFIHGEYDDVKSILPFYEDAKIFRTTPPDMGATAAVQEAQQRAYDRFVYASQVRDLVQATPEQLDVLLEKAGMVPVPEALNEGDLAKLPDFGALASRGSDFAAETLFQVQALPVADQNAIYREVGTWAEDAYARIAVATPRERVMTDLELAARVSESAQKLGHAITVPERTVDVATASTDDVIRAAVLTRDDTAADAIISSLEADEVIRRAPATANVAAEPALHVAETLRHDTYANIRELRQRIYRPGTVDAGGISPQVVEPKITRITNRRGATTAWEVQIGPDMRWEFRSKRDADAFVEEAKTEGIQPWRIEKVRGGHNGAYVAVNEVTGKKKFFYPANSNDGGAHFRARDYVAAQGDNAPISIADAIKAVEQHQLDEDALFAGGRTRPMRGASTDAEIVNDGGRVNDPNPVGPRSQRPNVRRVSDEQYQRRLESRTKQILREWDKDPTKGVPTKGDTIIALARADGVLTDDEVTYFRTAVPIYKSRRSQPVNVTIFDLFMQELDKADGDVLKAKRATASVIADSVRKMPEKDVPLVVKALKKPGRVYDKMTNFTREQLLYGLNAYKGGVVDGVTTAYTVYISGHRASAFKALSPKTWTTMFLHNLKGNEISHPILKMADQWGVKPGRNVIDVAARELQENAGDLLITRLIGEKASSPWKLGQAFRHAFDQSHRLTLWGDEFGRQLRKVLEGQQESILHNTRGVTSFYDKVIGVMGGGPEADAAVAKLKQHIDDVGAFTPKQVREITGSGQLMDEWRQSLNAAKKAADDEVDRVLFSYRQTKGDDAVRRVFLFHYWQSRAIVQHTKLAITNPLLLHRYAQMWEALDREAQRQGENGPLAPFKVWFEFMKGDGGLYGISNPIAIFVPWGMFAEAFDSRYKGEGNFEFLLRRTGLFINPMIQSAGMAMGAFRRAGDVTGTASIRNVIKQVLDWDRNNHNVLHLGPGLTEFPDDIQVWQERILARIGNYLGADVDEQALYDYAKPKQDVVIDIILEQAQEDFGVPYDQMSDVQKQEVQDAVWAVRNGESDNARANEAMSTASPWWQAPLNTALPGGFRTRSEAGQERRAQTSAAYDTPADQRTPEQENAMAQTDAVNAGSPEAATLDRENDALGEVGTPVQQVLYDGWNTIAFGNLQPGMMEIIGGKKYTSEQIMAMSPEDRKKLADLWVLDNHGTGQLEDYRKQRGEYIDTTTELGGYKDYQKRAREYGGGETRVKTGKAAVSDTGLPMPETTAKGGMRDFRQYLESVSPEFADEIGQERKRLQDQGLSGEELEARLDIWANSPSGYNAFRGAKDRIGDPAPNDTFDPSKQLPPPGPGEQATDSGSGKSSSGTKSDDYMPDYQVQLVTDWNAYSDAVTEFEQANGPLSNFQSPLGQKAVEQFFAERGITMSSDLKKYIAWKAERDAAGEDSSLKAYITKLNADYDQKKKDREAARKAIESQ